MPGVYYGDEFATTSDRAPGGADTALRPPMATTDPEQADSAAQDLLATVQRLGRLRRANPWLTTAVLTDVRLRRGVLTYTVTGADDAWRVHLNPTAAPITDDANHVDVPARGWVIRPGEPGASDAIC